MLIQHADLEPDLQRAGLSLMEQAVEAGEADPSDLAFLVDRVRVSDGQAQVYGTQWALTEDGEWVPRTPIENEAEVDTRRRAVGLAPLDEYLEELASLDG